MNMKRKSTKCTHLVGNLSVIFVGAGAGGPSPSKPYKTYDNSYFYIFSFSFNGTVKSGNFVTFFAQTIFSLEIS